MIELYKNIKDKRLALGMTQTELALKVGYSEKSSIARIEKGEIDLPLSKMHEFAKALNCTTSELMGWDSDVGLQQNPSYATKLGTLINDKNFEKLTDIYLRVPDDKKSKAVSIFESLTNY